MQESAIYIQHVLSTCELIYTHVDKTVHTHISTSVHRYVTEPA